MEIGHKFKGNRQKIVVARNISVSIYRNCSLARQTQVKWKKNLTSPYERLEQARTAKFAKYCRNKVFLCSPSQFHPRTPRGGQSGRKKRRDLSFQAQAE